MHVLLFPPQISRKKLEDSRERLRGRNDVEEVRRHRTLLKQAEDRLETTLCRLNEQTASNSQLQSGVDDLRRDKMQRQAIVSKLQDEVARATEEADAYAQEQREVAETRDAMQREIQTLQTSIQRELENFEREFEERINSVSASFEPTKLEAIDQSASKGESTALLLHLGSEEAHQGSLSISQERELKHKSTKSLWDIARRQVELKEQETTLSQYEEAFSKIQDGTHIETIDEMVDEFVAAEDRHFSLINMVNEIGNEIKDAEVETNRLRERVQFVKSSSKATEMDHEAQFGAYDRDIAAAQSRSESFDRRYERLLRYLDAVRPGVHSLFQKVGTSDDAAVESLAATGVTESNLLDFMGMIERRVSELTQAQEAIASGALEDLQGQLGAAEQSPLFDNDDDDVWVPGTRHTLVGGEGAMSMPHSVRVPPIPPAIGDAVDDEGFGRRRRRSLVGGGDAASRRSRRSGSVTEMRQSALLSARMRGTQLRDDGESVDGAAVRPVDVHHLESQLFQPDSTKHRAGK